MKKKGKLDKSLWEKITVFFTGCIVFLTFCIVLANYVLARSTCQLADSTHQLVQDNRELVKSNNKLVDYTRQSNERAEKLSIGQSKPLIGVAPIGISQVIETHSETRFSVVNYSGFPAYNIAIDLRYGKSKAWISEWDKARIEKGKKGEKKGEKKGVVIGHCYPSTPKVLIQKLCPGKTEDKDFEGKPLTANGAIDLEKEVCIKGNEGHTIWVRVTWQNKRGHVFDEIHQYKLIGTKDTDNTGPGTGRAFTFIPEGIISHKNMR